MFHFNCHTRVGRYMHHVSGVPGLDYCYDCRAEVAILTNYITKCTDMQADAVGIPSAVAKMSLECVVDDGGMRDVGATSRRDIVFDPPASTVHWDHARWHTPTVIPCDVAKASLAAKSVDAERVERSGRIFSSCEHTFADEPARCPDSLSRDVRLFSGRLAARRRQTQTVARDPAGILISICILASQPTYYYREYTHHLLSLL